MDRGNSLMMTDAVSEGIRRDSIRSLGLQKIWPREGIEKLLLIIFDRQLG